jgi:hypothetical protein
VFKYNTRYFSDGIWRNKIMHYIWANTVQIKTEERRSIALLFVVFTGLLKVYLDTSSISEITDLLIRGLDSGFGYSETTHNTLILSALACHKASKSRTGD